MKKSLMILLCISIPFFLMAQETIKQKEIGLVFNNLKLDNFGIIFKTGSNKSLWRFHTLFLSGNNTEQIADSSEDKYNRMGFRFKFGKEYCKDLTEKMEFRYGADISFGYTYSKSEHYEKIVNGYDRFTEIISYEPGVNLILGINYKINNVFTLGIELLPYITYITGTTTANRTNNDNDGKSDISEHIYGFSSSSIKYSLTYIF